jgi:hypothetical protein
LRFRDYGIVVLDGNGRQLTSTVTDSRLQNGLKNLSAEVSFADLPHETETFRIHQIPLQLDGKPFQLLITRSLQVTNRISCRFKKNLFHHPSG